jgi:hypothetical protein
LNDDISTGSMAFESSVCFHFGKTLKKLDIAYKGWKLAAYWREKGYDT